ncbi:MAG: hypothetical protein CVV58_01405 [Tenericutes bacterium HGW-Tenericutes-3]|nr:MAG: hypothetical protein CVV58_01405 [Tenericutes bacterium HGW-Tenericutes-3]
MKFLKNPLILASIYLLFSFAILATFFFTSYRALETKQEELLDIELQLTISQINLDFESVRSVLSTLSNHLEVDFDDADFLQYIQQVDEKNEIIASIYFGKSDKTMINSTGFVPPVGFDLTTRIWYQMAIASDEVILTPAFINATQDRVILTAAKAVYGQDETFLGVIAVDVDIRTITSIVTEKEIGKSGFAFLIDLNGNLLAYPGINQTIIELDSAAEYEPNLASLSGSGVIHNFQIQNKVGVVSYKVITSNNFILGVFLPIEEFTSSLMILSIIFSALMIALIALAVILTIIYYRRIRQPLAMLLEDIDSVDMTKTPNYRLPEPEKDDYLNIRLAINRILDTTDFYFNERQKAQHKLMIENQRVVLLMESTADIIFEIDLNKKFVSVFGRGLDTLGIKPQAFTGKTVMDLFGDDGKARDIAYSKALKGIHSIYDWTYIKNNQKLYFESSISPMYDEFKNIIGAVGISRDISEPMRKQKEIEYISIHDFLTGLYNRRHFVEAFSELDEEDNYPLGMMMIDLNGLKILNDAYGHDTGDRALKKVADVLKLVSREDDIVCRIGGDEFAIILLNIDVQTLDTMKETIQLRLSNILIENIPLSVAIGYEMKKDSTLDLEDVIKNAENQMYRNKVTEGRSSRNNAIKAILKTLTDKFVDEKTHSTRVSELCKKMGIALSVKSDDLKELEIAGLFHDIGKISIPDDILYKPARLTPEEFDIIKTHTENGYHILRAADEYSNLAEYALSHHEHFDGRGYPRGLKGKDIPLFSRIICIADAYEAMTSDRVYRKKMSDQDAVKEIVKYAGTQFDPELAKIFVEKVLGYPFK